MKKKNQTKKIKVLEVGHAVFPNPKREEKTKKEAKLEVEVVVEAGEEIKTEEDEVNQVEVKALNINQKVREVLFKLNDSIEQDMTHQILGVVAEGGQKDPDQNHVQERDLGTDEKIKDHLDPDLNLESENAVVDEKGNNVKESEETEKEKKENGNENVRKNVNVEKRNDVGKENGKENVCVKESDEKENIGTEKEEIERKKKEQKRNGKIVKSARHPANHPLLKMHLPTEVLTRREFQKNPGQGKNPLETILILLKKKKV